MGIGGFFGYLVVYQGACLGVVGSSVGVARFGCSPFLAGLSPTLMVF